MKRNLLGILAMVFVLGIMVLGCDNNQDNSDGDGGIFTITNIPVEYNERYVYIRAEDETLLLVGAAQNNLLNLTGVKISNGSVSIPMWILGNNYYNSKKYSGNHTVEVYAEIIDSSIVDSANQIAVVCFESITFSNGNATVLFNEGVFNGYINANTNTDEIAITSISAYKYGPYPDDNRVHCILLLRTNIYDRYIDRCDPEWNINWGFEIIVNGQNKIPSVQYGWGPVQYYGSDIRIMFDSNMFIPGQHYNIQVKYIADENREIKVFTIDGKKFIQKSFDTGVKNIIARQW
jgi:hypothetical protein